MSYEEVEFNTTWDEITDEQSAMKERILKEIDSCGGIAESLNMLSFVLGEFVARTAPDKESANLAIAWLAACTAQTIDRWDKEETCNWSGTRQ